MSRIVRVSITFPPDLLRKLDEAIGKMGYNSRSKAIQDATRSFLKEYQLHQQPKGSSSGVLVFVYDHEVRGLEEILTDTQHEYSHIISSAMHVHLSERECLEVVAIKGDADEIRKLAHELATKRGVRQLRTTIVSP